MAEQPELFDVGQRERTPRPQVPCTAGPIGSGPAGETCGSCEHKTKQDGTAGKFLKCALMRKLAGLREMGAEKVARCEPPGTRPGG